jgi:hypothetical protein
MTLNIAVQVQAMNVDAQNKVERFSVAGSF